MTPNILIEVTRGDESSCSYKVFFTDTELHALDVISCLDKLKHRLMTKMAEASAKAPDVPAAEIYNQVDAITLKEIGYEHV